MKNIIPYLPGPKGAPDCLNCVHHSYEEDAEEVEVLICYLNRRPIRDPETDADGCAGYYTGANE